MEEANFFVEGKVEQSLGNLADYRQGLRVSGTYITDTGKQRRTLCDISMKGTPLSNEIQCPIYPQKSTCSVLEQDNERQEQKDRRKGT